MNVPATAALAKASGIPVIASGGVRDLTDMKAVKQAAGDGIEGVIVGKAIYTGTLQLADAIRLLRESEIMYTKRIIPCLDVKDGESLKVLTLLGLETLAILLNWHLSMIKNWRMN